MNKINRVAKSQNIVMTLLIINVAVFFLQEFTNLAIFALIPSLVAQGYIFELFTYMFLHGGFFHIFINMYALLIFGTAIEQIWGSKKFLIYYLITGIGAGLCIFIMNYFVIPDLMNIPTIGASGAIFGILLAFGILFPDNIILLFFVIPLKAKYMVILYGGLELYFFFTQSASGISHVGHLGGLLAGILYFVFIDKK
jgi:membrane associated rhomboid family serine protease